MKLKRLWSFMAANTKWTPEQLRLQRTIVAYLGYKLGVDESWYTTKQDFLFDKTPEQIVDEGDAKLLIDWMEERLGLKPGQGF